MSILPAKLAAATASAALGLVSLTPIAALADTSISTGSSNVSVSISNELNSNVAEISGGGGGSIDVNISGNGSRSRNAVFLNQTSRNSIRQSNFADVTNNVEVVSNTGGNHASSNTESFPLIRLRNFCMFHPMMCH